MERSPRVRLPVATSASTPPRAVRSHNRIQWVFNARFFWISLGVATLLILCGSGWRWIQVQRQAGTFREQAEWHVAQEQWRDALLNLEHYVALRPGDIKAQVLLAQVYDKTAQGPNQRRRAMERMALAVGLTTEEEWKTEQRELRIRYAELLLADEAFSLARTEANHVLDRLVPNEPRSLRVKAIGMLEEFKLQSPSSSGPVTLESVMEAGDAAVRARPEDVELVERLSTEMRRIRTPANRRDATDRPNSRQWADKLFDDLVSRRQDAEALLARYHYRREFDLQHADDDLDRAEEMAPELPEVLISLAERELQRNEPTRAEKHLHKLIEVAPDRLEGYLMLAAMLRRDNRIREALPAIQRAYERFGRNHLFLRMEEVGLLIADDQLEEADRILAQVEREVTVLANHLGTRNRDELLESAALLRASVHVQRNDFDNALERLARYFPTRRPAVPNDPAGQRYIRALELRTSCHAAREQWNQLDSTLEELIRIQPNQPLWVLTLGQARLEQQRQLPVDQRNWQPFLNSLARATESGEFSDRLGLLLAEYHLLTGHLFGVLQRLEAMQTPTVVSEETSPIVAAASFSELLPQSSHDEPRKPLDHLLRQSDGEKTMPWFRDAVEELPHDVEAWTGMLAALWRLEQHDELKDQLAKLTQLEDFPEPPRGFLLAQGYHLLDDPESAQPFYVQALRSGGNSGEVSRQYAACLFGLPPHETRNHLEAWLREDAGNREALRAHAYLLAAEGRWHEAEQIWKEMSAGPSGEQDPLEPRSRAVQWLQRPGPTSRGEAMAILESLVQDSETSHGADHLLLAQLHAMDGQSDRADEQFRLALERDESNESAMRAYIDFLFERGEADSAGPWVNRLFDTQPNRLPNIGRRARWLFAMGQEDEAIDELQNAYARIRDLDLASDDRMQTLHQLGQWFESIEAGDEARQMFQEAHQENPERFASWLGFLIAHGSAPQAITTARRLLQGTAPADSRQQAEFVMLLCRVMTHVPALPEEMADLDPIIRQTALRDDASPELLLAVGTYYQIQGDSEFALTLLRQLVKLVPDSPHILNNLAYLLSEQPDGLEEAEQWLDQAIAIVGRPNAQLLDTQGMIQFRRGEWERAGRSFQDALQYGPKPEIWFHLALAQFHLGEIESARRSLDSAQAAGLSRAPLSPGDRALWKQLTDELEAAGRLQEDHRT